MVNRDRDTAYRLTQQRTNGVIDQSYGPYDANGNLTGLSFLSSTSGAQSFGYDALNRLTAANDSLFDQGFSYDKNSNRLQLTDTGTTTDYGYEVESNRLSQVGLNAYSLDANGNTLSDGQHDYIYNPYNHLIDVDGLLAYQYNALSQRSRKSGVLIDTSFVYGLTGQLLRDYNAISALNQEFIYLGDRPVAVIAQDKVYYLHSDHLGTPREVSDPDTNTVVWRWDSDPFGRTAANEDPDGDGNNFIFNLRFPGQYYDSETGLHYNYFRYYDPKAGRYITSDPIGVLGLLNGAANRVVENITLLPDIVAVEQSQPDISQIIQSIGINTYAYVYGNPLIYYDLLGLDRYDWCKGIPGCKPTTNWTCSKVPGYCCQVERDQCIKNAQTNNGCLDEGKVAKCQINYGKCLLKQK